MGFTFVILPLKLTTNPFFLQFQCKQDFDFYSNNQTEL